MKICVTNFSNSAVAMVAAFTLTAFSSASAMVLAEYDFGGSTGHQVSNAAISVASNLQVSDFSRGAGYAGVQSTVTTFGENTMATNPGFATLDDTFQTAGYSLDSAIAGNGYFEFSITVEEGYAFSLDSIELGTRRASNKSGPNFLVVRSSLDNYASNLIAPTGTAGNGGNTSSSLTLDFGNLVQNVENTVTFRIYGYGRNETSTSYGIFGISNPGATAELPSGAKNFTINGSVAAIPEPSTIALGAFGLGLLGYTVRRKRAMN